MSEQDAESIGADSGEEPRFSGMQTEDDNMVTVLLRMERVEDGIAFLKTTQTQIIMPEIVMPYRRYPVSYM